MAISVSQTLIEAQRRKYFRNKHILRKLRMPIIVLLLIVLFECTLGNIPFWNSVAGSTDSFSAHNNIGAGLQRLHSGGLKILYPSEAYIEVISDGSSPYIRLQPASKPPKKLGNVPIIKDIHVRIDVNSHAGKYISANPRATNGAIIPIPEEGVGKPGILRIWIQHPADSIIDLEDARANVRVPFSFSWGRIGILILISLIIAAWNPWSKLWKIKLNTSNIYHQIFFIIIILPFILNAVKSIVESFMYSTPLHFDVEGNYTYDFDQYNNTAKAFLNGHTYLDLPVPHELTQLANPYDPSARDKLLASGVSNIYWDHSYYQGHWYSYFGVVPTILFFLPFQAISSIFTHNAISLPTSSVTFLCIIGFLISGSLLVISLVRRVQEQASLGTASCCVAMFLVSSNISYLWFRPSFYSVPIAASMMFTTIGLLCWIHARKSDSTFSKTYFILGTFFIAINLGCRPTFAIAFIFIFPIFGKKILDILRNILADYKNSSSWKELSKFIAITFIPIAIIAIPLGFYNSIRFGSPFKFGNEYQITVTDMTKMRIPADNILPSIISYLALPLRIIPDFPWIGIQPISFNKWQYSEPMIGGIFSICPLVLLGIISAIAFYKHTKNKYVANIAITSIASAFILVIFDSLKAGIGWRYMADFSWLFAIGATVGITLFLEKIAVLNNDDTLINKVSAYSIRAIFISLILFSIAIIFLSWFTVGREDSLVKYDPDLWYNVRAWLTLL